MKVFKYLIISSILFTATSCGDDWLNLEPSTSVDTETSINVLSDIEFTLNGIYSTMQSSDAYSGRLVYYGDVTGDDMQAVSSTKRTTTASTLPKTMVPLLIGHISILLSKTAI